LKNKILPPAFDRGTIYDYCYLPETNEWKNWTDFTNKDEIDQFPKGSKPNEIIVTTVDTIRYGYLQELFIMNDIRSLFVGPTGTGKTAYIQNVLQNKLPQDKWLIIEIGFSAQTHCNQVQDIVDMKLDKRRKDHFGPRFGMRCVVFVDDLNMPKPYLKSQPPIEILRQLVDQGGWYDRKDNKHPFRNIVDTMIVAAMGTPGGGKSFITPRFQRHFNIIAFANFDENSMKTIFSSILKWHFRTGNFSNEIQGMVNNIVIASLKIYTNIQADLKPTPLKSHYTFNLRDISKVICGMTMPTNKQLIATDSCLRLWAHETSRIFGDRLINNEDRMWMLNAIKDITRAPFGQSFDNVFSHLDTDKNGKVETLDEFRGLAFGDIFTNFGVPDRPYEEIIDKVKLSQAADEHLVQYNNNSDKPMPLVLFNFAIEHLMRIGRVLKQPGGHLLLVGVGGSGRQSLARLASKIADFDVYQVEIKKNYRTQEWREDLKSMMRLIGGKGNSTSFLFTDTQIK
jgi:dynein heavy chain